MEKEKLVGNFSFRKEKPRSLWRVNMSFSPDENTIAAYYEESDQEGLHFLLTEDLSLTRTMQTGSRTRPVMFLPDGALLLGTNGRCQLADPATLEITKVLAPTTGWDVDYLPAKSLIAVGGSGSITVFNTETQEQVAEYQAASHNIVLVKFTAGARHIVYASPKGESGIIDCTTGRPIQVFSVGRDAAVSRERYLLLAEGRAIDLSSCRDHQMSMPSQPRGAEPRPDVPEAVRDFILNTLEEQWGQHASYACMVRKTAKSFDGKLVAYGTEDGRTVICAEPNGELRLLKSRSFRRPIDLVLLAKTDGLLRLAKTGNGMAGAVELYSQTGEVRSTLRLHDPPRMVALSEEEETVAIVDEKNRVLLSAIPELEIAVELLPATRSQRQISIDSASNRLLVMTDGAVSSFDLTKVGSDRQLLTYEEAVKRYGVSLKETEPLWSLVGP